MATLTNIVGTLYDATGVALNVGKLYIALQQDIISVDGTKVAPTTIEVNLASTAGVVDIDVYATQGASPSGVSYRVQYDPDPADTTKPMTQKEGYWCNYWSVPNTATVALGSFTQALRGSTVQNYIPLGDTAGTAGSLAGYVVVTINGAQKKMPYYNFS